MECRDIPSNRKLLPALLAKSDSSRGLIGNRKHGILAFLSTKHFFLVLQKISLTPVLIFSTNKEEEESEGLQELSRHRIHIRNQ